MAQVLRGHAKTTYAIRKEIQNSKESIAVLARRFGVSQRTVRKWKNRDFVEDLKCGRRKGQGTNLTPLQEQIIVEVRTKKLHTLDDIYVMFKDKWPNLTRSNLY
ncbi:MAG: helix-turn-helix domain-containing protein, partial [Deltaproteobacteria bacterium]|nr:helix-turn-helix domain-containing protein [Deltaproteobacteria bacterium]